MADYRQALEAKGLTVDILQDGNERWRNFIAGHHARNPSLYPAPIVQCVSLHVYDGAEMIALNCARRYRQRSLAALVDSGDLWREPGVIYQPPTILGLPADWPVIEGAIVQNGGAWVHPRYRGQGIGALIGRLIRQVAYDVLDADHSVGLEIDTRGGKRPEALGYARYTKIAEGVDLPDENLPMPLWLTHISRREDLGRVESPEPQELIGFV